MGSHEQVGVSLIGYKPVADISTPALQHVVIKVTEESHQITEKRTTGYLAATCQYPDHSPASAPVAT